MIRNLPIRLKLATIYVLMAIFTLPMIFFFYQSAKGINDGQQAIHGQMMAGTRSAGQMMAALEAQNAAARAAATGDVGGEAALADAKAAYSEAQSALAAQLEGDAEAIALAEGIEQRYSSEFSPALGAVAEGGGESEALTTATTAMAAELDTLLDHLEAGAAQLNVSGNARMRFLLPFIPVFLLVYVGATLVLGRRITASLAFPMQDLEKAAKRIARGDVAVEVTHQSKDEVGGLADAFREMVAGIRQQADVLAVIAEGDYTVSIPVRSEEDLVNRAIATMLDNNNQLVSGIRESATQVTSASQQLAQGAQSLASGTTQQAATIQQLSAALDGVHGQSEANSRLAGEAADESRQAGDMMQQGLQSMNSLAGAMAGIEESSRNIASIIKVIDDIAFQTNILALNAAVEAARAGEHGKGFAVVADEVRNLASKSADAAKETSSLIESSVERVAEGNAIAASTKTSIEAVAEIAASSAGKMQQINDASRAQNASIGEVSQGIEQLSTVVQQNSATAEQSAASSEEMRAQAEGLQTMVSRFRLRGKAGMATPAETPSAAPALPPAGYSDSDGVLF